MGSLESIAHRYATAVLQRNKPDEAEAVYRDFISTGEITVGSMRRMQRCD